MLKIVGQKNKTCYPYGMLLTRLIRNKGTVLNSMTLDETPILSAATLAELGLKNEDGVDFSVNPRISENVVSENIAKRILDDSEDDKPIVLVLKRKRNDLSVVEKKKKKINKITTGETLVSVPSSLPKLVAGLSQSFNKKKRIT